jgi:hypothetical protein
MSAAPAAPQQQQQQQQQQQRTVGYAPGYTMPANSSHTRGSSAAAPQQPQSYYPTSLKQPAPQPEHMPSSYYDAPQPDLRQGVRDWGHLLSS